MLQSRCALARVSGFQGFRIGIEDLGLETFSHDGQKAGTCERMVRPVLLPAAEL